MTPFDGTSQPARTTGDKFARTLEGQAIRDRGIAGELLLRRAERMRGSHAERQVGAIASFSVLVADNFMHGPEIVLKGTTTYIAKLTDTALGTIRSVEHTIQHLEDLTESLVKGMADTRKRLAETHAQVGLPFEYAAQLAGLQRRRSEIEDALDLTKSQAPSRLDSDATEDNADGNSKNDLPSRPPGLGSRRERRGAPGHFGPVERIPSVLENCPAQF